MKIKGQKLSAWKSFFVWLIFVLVFALAVGSITQALISNGTIELEPGREAKMFTIPVTSLALGMFCFVVVAILNFDKGFLWAGGIVMTFLSLNPIGTFLFFWLAVGLGYLANLGLKRIQFMLGYIRK